MLNFDFPCVSQIPKGCGLCLDLGCGSGIHRKQIEGSGYRWIGLDIDTSRGAARLLEGDACHLPFKSETFSIIFMNCVLEHVSNPWIALSEARRVLVKEGIIIGVSGYLDPDPTHKCLLTELGLKQVFTDVGFKKLEFTAGTSAFPIILRKLHMTLFGYNPRLNTLFGFAISKLLWAPFNFMYFFIRIINHLLKGRPLSTYKKSMMEMSAVVQVNFAAYFIFSAVK